MPPHARDVGPLGCWVWIGSLDAHGHGRIMTERRNVNGHGKATRAHRISWEIHYGEIPPGKSVYQHCGVPACVRPDHLRCGTMKDVMANAQRLGRLNTPRGVSNGRTKLTDEHVRGIRALLRRGFKQKPIAQLFGVSPSTVSAIHRRRRRQHVR